MIATFFYSVANHSKRDDAIDECLHNMVALEYINAKDKRTAEYFLECSEKGNYPSEDYLANIYEKPSDILKTTAEIVLQYRDLVDFHARQYIQRDITTAINETSTSADLLTRLSKLINDTEAANIDEFNFDDCVPELYGDSKPLENGLLTGITELDKVTCGFQRGTVASICGFTGHGKSTAINSAVYMNVMQGKKVLIFSIELPPDLTWKQFETRYMFEEKSLGVDVHSMTQHTLSESVEGEVKSFEPDFKRDVVPNLLIIDESKITKKIMTDYRKINKLLRAAERKLGGLDMVVVDHVGQLELLYPETGNIILKQLTSAAKTYKNERGEKIAMIWAVQCNREGNRRAIRREGQYDLQAIADLNEVERSSSYCVFLYTSDGMKITQETKVSMLKNRLGVPIPTPFVTSFTPAVVMVGRDFERANINDVDFSFTEMGSDYEDIPPF